MNCYDHQLVGYRNPEAVIYKTTTAATIAPFIASFSARGPQSVSRNILKPDIAAPGLNILAAFSQLVSITREPSDNRISPFNIVSGTSMACPHAAAAAAYVKSFNPTWSPAAIKSALMTTGNTIYTSLEKCFFVTAKELHFYALFCYGWVSRKSF